MTRISARGFSAASEALEEEWHESGYRAGKTTKNTVASRIDPQVAAKLEAFVRGKGGLS